MTAILELTISVSTIEAEHASVQAIVALFEEYAPSGAVVEISGFGPYGEQDHAQIVVRGYLTQSQASLDLVQVLRQQLPDDDRLGELQVRSLVDADWTEAWKEHYRPLRIGQRIVVSPTWLEPESEPGDPIIWLDPGMAFGTGTHPSTQLILVLLEKYIHANDQVLDVGTGSGILSIAALKLGAASVYATDIEADAIDTARENAESNAVDGDLTLVVGSVPNSGRYPLICANILADVLAELLLREGLADRLAPGGVLLLSGIIEARRHLVDLALAALSLKVIDTVQDGDWLALAVQHSD